MPKQGSEHEPRDGALPASSFALSPEHLAQFTIFRAPSRPGVLGQLDQYDILRIIGVGGMGLVFLGRDRNFQKSGCTPGESTPSPGSSEGLVAIKVLKPEFLGDRRAAEYFLKEASHMQGLDHPNILRVLAVSEQPERPYFVMPFLERGSLARLITPGKPLPTPLIMTIARQLAAALKYAHCRELIHRDLKPGNVLLDSNDCAYLTDFGLARTVFNDSLLDVRRTDNEGTAVYMSPAVAAGEAEDTRRDIYAFGALLYEMLTGQPPYCGGTTEEVLQQIRAGPPRPISSLNPEAHPGLVAIAEHAMARSLRERYADMGDVLEDLDRVMKGEAPASSVAEPARWKRWKRLVRVKRKRLAWTAGIGVLAAVAIWMQATAARVPSLGLVRRIDVPGVWNWTSAEAGKWHSQNAATLFVPNQNRLTFVSANSGQVLGEWVVPEPGPPLVDAKLLVRDLNGDTFDEVCLNWRSGTNLYLSILNQNLHELKRFRTGGAAKQTLGSAQPASTIWPFHIIDLEGDGRRELLATVSTGYELKPRGVYCFDFEDQSLKWSHQTGPIPSGLVTVDLDGDGTKEVVVGSDAVDNGNRAEDGTDDEHSYLYAFSGAGKLLWRRELGGIYTRVNPLVVHSTTGRAPALIAWARGVLEFLPRLGTPEKGTVFRLNHRGEVTGQYEAGAILCDGITADLDGDGAGEILVADRLGFVHALTDELVLRKRARIVPNKFEQVRWFFRALGDLDGDNLPEIVLTCSQVQSVSGLNSGRPEEPHNVRILHDNSVLVLKPSLELQARFVVSPKWEMEPGFSARITDVDGDARPEIVALANQALVLRYRR